MQMELSTDPASAEQQIEAIIFYLTTCGYIDSEFDLSEKAFIRKYLRTLVTNRVDQHTPDLNRELRFETIEREHEHYLEIFQRIDHEVKELFSEAVADSENIQQFVQAKLKLRCFELFQELSEKNRNALLTVVDDFISADGVIHAKEVQFRNELALLLEQEVHVEERQTLERGVTLKPAAARPVVQDNHPFFKNFEHHYSADPETMHTQMQADLNVLTQSEAIFTKQRAQGHGRLTGKQTLEAFRGQKGFLDGHVYLDAPAPGKDYELIVLGDLHGCYSCLKAAVLQSDFMNKLHRHQQDPERFPDVRLIFLGDYIDRGRFSYNGILRTVLKLFIAAPDHVYVLRGNHEYYIKHEGRIYGGVRPAEAINTLTQHAPLEVFERYLDFFDQMPNLLLFDRSVFVHGGIPRDKDLRTHWKDLSSLNQDDLRFQMLWSDPSRADVIPDELQAASARFPFGRLQFRDFMRRLGGNLMVRGHEKVNAGFKNVYRDEDLRLFTLFSAGGVANNDLPQDSSYRDVRPMALTISSHAGLVEATPWAIDYRRYQNPDLNAFFKAAPEIDMKH